MSNAANDPGQVIHYFVDEAGDPTLFDRKGRIIVGNSAGCSTYFILGKLDVDDPAGLTSAMDKLRADLLTDPYFRGIPSMQLTAGKTASMFHAKDDIPEVRREVFKLLLAQPVRFYAVVRDKRQVVGYVRQQNERDEQYHYTENELYDTLVSHLFRTRLYRADQFNICFSRRGNSDRTAALRTALQSAIAQFERDFGVKNRAVVNISHGSPPGSGGLQAVDYFLWALQRFYEYQDTDKRESECRYVELIQGQIGEINDLEYSHDGKRGILWGPHRPLSLAARIAAEAGAKKKPGI